MCVQHSNLYNSVNSSIPYLPVVNEPLLVAVVVAVVGVWVGDASELFSSWCMTRYMELGMASGWYFLLLPPRLPGGEESCRGEGRERGILHTHLAYASPTPTRHSHTHALTVTPSHPHNITYSQGEAQAQGRSVFWSCSAFYDRICQPLPYSLPLTWGIT